MQTLSAVSKPVVIGQSIRLAFQPGDVMMIVMFVIYDNVDGDIYFEEDQGHDVTSPSKSLTRVELSAVSRMRHLSILNQRDKLMILFPPSQVKMSECQIWHI